MIPALRKAFNEKFTSEAYQSYVADLSNKYPGSLEFRIAETPVFVPQDFTQKVLSACEDIIAITATPEYIQQSKRAVPPHLNVPNEDERPHCIAFDFGVCINENGGLEPQLIEMQGFPTLWAWEAVIPEIYEAHFWSPEGFTAYLNGYNKEGYIRLLKKLIIGDHAPENVILLEILPDQQKTRVDFRATEDLIGIKTVCLTKLLKEGRYLFYEKDGVKTQVHRIYNRVIFDDLFQQAPEIQEKGKIFMEDLAVEWVPHPNWFYKLSKFTLPFVKHPYVPETHFLNEASIPEDLENYVVKPLFSFAGQGVIIDVTKADIENIPDPENWILQRKVTYADAVVTPDGSAKAEMRIFYFWEPDEKKYVPANNLSRLSKGKMIGVRYNKDKEWVGGSFCLFEE